MSDRVTAPPLAATLATALPAPQCPTGADQAWWCPAKAAGQIVRAANASGKDVAQAAARLHMRFSPHAVVAERAAEAVRRIDCTLNAARLRGDLAFFNRAHKARRRPRPLRGAGHRAMHVRSKSTAAEGGVSLCPALVALFSRSRNGRLLHCAGLRRGRRWRLLRAAATLERRARGAQRAMRRMRCLLVCPHKGSKRPRTPATPFLRTPRWSC